ncbi:MAG: uncharacterized protein KVP18_000199 [Porospora cf. gigantea A]|uniref:uncharacterized protein n=2 Tax=Porospora cf. gigantea A TaxID=2853593 RepID=UPI00355A5AFE|nr:MAG: hypothetical protein KVP18_000199 [Porospora cf. gigantea A]
MYASRNEYDRGVNTFSPEGRLFQVEYAIEAVKLGSTAVGMKCSEGVVLVTERRLPSALIEANKGDFRKILEIDAHVGCASSGIIADARTMIDHARVECQNHWFNFNEKMPIESVVDSISDLALDFSGVGRASRKKRMSRPFGAALLVAGVDASGPHLWSTDPSGTNTSFKASSVGSAHEGAESLLLEKYEDTLTFEQTEALALEVLRQGMEEKMTPSNVEVACVRVGGSFHLYSQDEIRAIIERLPEPLV